MTDLLSLIGYKDGEYIPVKNIGPSVLDFGFIHCDSTYDVMPIYNGRAFCFDRHLERFKNSTTRYGLDIPEIDVFKIVKRLYNINTFENAFVWFLAWRGFPPSGNPRDIANCPVHFAMYIKPSFPLVNKTTINVFVNKKVYRVNDRYFGQQYKNMSWIDLTLAQRSVPEGYDTCVLVDDRGCITEGPGFNVGFVNNNKVITPYRNCLKGITMSVVEDISKEQNLKFIKTDIVAEDWDNMDEIFLTSSSGGVTPVKLGPVTEILINEYEKKKNDSRYSTAL